MNKKLLLLPILLLSLTGCNPKNQDNKGTESETITDMIGREVSVKPGSYSKIVCIGAGALRMYSYIGDVSKLAGVEDIDNETSASHPKMFDNVARPYYIANKEVFDTLPSCGVGGPNAQSAEAEKIISCNPDLVISEYEDVTKENTLQEQIGVPVVTIRYGSAGIFDENVKNSITLLGKILGKENRATELNTYISTQKTTIQQKVSGVAEDSKPATYICGLGMWGTTNHLYTSQNYAPFTVANIKNAVTGLSTGGVTKITEEKFVATAADTDIMIMDAAAIKNIKPLYAADNTLFSSSKAWTNGEVYLQLAYNCYYTNLELALVNTWWNAKVVYPSLFEDLDINAKLSEVTTEFLGKDLTTAINAKPFSYGGYQKINTATFFA